MKTGLITNLRTWRVWEKIVFSLLIFFSFFGVVLNFWECQIFRVSENFCYDQGNMIVTSLMIIGSFIISLVLSLVLFRKIKLMFLAPIILFLIILMLN